MTPIGLRTAFGSGKRAETSKQFTRSHSGKEALILIGIRVDLDRCPRPQSNSCTLLFYWRKQDLSPLKCIQLETDLGSVIPVIVLCMKHVVYNAQPDRLVGVNWQEEDSFEGVGLPKNLQPQWGNQRRAVPVVSPLTFELSTPLL